MPKTATQYICQSCGAAQSRWGGKCPDCGAWNSLVETAVIKSQGTRQKAQSLKPITLGAVDTKKFPRITTSIPDFDQVLGGGLVPGSVILLSGDPGIGKSTLVLQVAAQIGASKKVLYVSGEESAAQIKLRAERLGLAGAKIDLITEADVDSVAATIDGYDLVIIDSIQTMSTGLLTGAAGSVGQVTASAQLLQAAAKSYHAAMIIIGHVTKEGSIAGPKVLEHLVDVVLYLEGDRYGNFKALRGIKNRFGSTDEVGIFEMTEAGLVDVENPSVALLAERQEGAGSVVAATMEGTRPLLVEVQALVSTTSFGYPKRTAVGFDLNRLNLLVAVLTKRVGLNLSNQDIYVNIVGGLKVAEPAIDLAIILSIASAFTGHAPRPKTVVFGEVGLSGEVRSVSQAIKRTGEAGKLGFIHSVGPAQAKTIADAMRIALESSK